MTAAGPGEARPEACSWCRPPERAVDVRSVVVGPAERAADGTEQSERHTDHGQDGAEGVEQADAGEGTDHDEDDS